MSAECTIKVNIETNGSVPDLASGTGISKAIDSMNLNSSEHKAKYPGHAFAEGTEYKGLPKAEKNALVSEYGQTEMTVLPNGDTIVTDEPTLMDLPKDTVIYNEEQTKKIMDNKVDVSGKAHAGGTEISQMEYIQMLREQSAIKNNLISADEIPPEMPLLERMEKCAVALGRDVKDMLNPLNSIALDIRKQTDAGRFLESINNVSNVTNNNRNVQQPVTFGDINVICPGVTEQQVAEKLPGVLNRTFSGFHNLADQYSRT